MGNLSFYWWEFRLVQPLWKAVWRLLKKLNMDLPFDPVIPLLGIYLKESKTLIWNHTNLDSLIWNTKHAYVPCRIIYNHQVMEAAQVSISRWMDKTIMGHLHNGILLGYKKEGNFTHLWQYGWTWRTLW